MSRLSQGRQQKKEPQSPSVYQQMMDSLKQQAQANKEIKKKMVALEDKLKQYENKQMNREKSSASQLLQKVNSLFSVVKQKQKNLNSRWDQISKSQQKKFDQLKQFRISEIHKLEQQIKKNKQTISRQSQQYTSLQIKNRQLSSYKVDSVYLISLKQELKSKDQLIRNQSQKLSERKRQSSKFNDETNTLKDKLLSRMKILEQKNKIKQNAFQQFKAQIANTNNNNLSKTLKSMIEVIEKICEIKNNIEAGRDLHHLIKNFSSQIAQIKKDIQEDRELTLLSSLSTNFSNICKEINKQLQQKNKDKLKFDKQMLDINAALNQTIDEKERDVVKHKRQIEKLESKIKEQKNQWQIKQNVFIKQKKELQTKIQKLTIQLAQLKSDYDKMFKEKQALEKKCEDQVKTINCNNQQIKEQLKNIDSLTKAKKQLEEIKKSLQNLVNKIENQLSQEKQINRQKTEKIQRLERKIKELERIIKELESKIRNQQQTIKNQQLLIKQLQTIKQQLTNELKKTNQKLKLTQNDLKNQKDSHRETKLTLNTKLDQNSQLSQELQDSLQEIKSLRVIEQAFKLLNKNFLPELSYHMDKKTKVIFDPSNPQKSVQSTLEWFTNKYNEAKFFGDSEVIPRYGVDFLIKQIKSFTKCHLASTKLLFRYDTRSSLNFHHFIDNKEHLFIVIRLINDTIIGGFSWYALERENMKRNGYGKGFLFNLNIEKVFQTKKDFKYPMFTYDEFFFIFGNAELRLKSRDKIFYSNFETANGIFDPDKVKRQDFMGTSTRVTEIEIQSYEFYQIEFLS